MSTNRQSSGRARIASCSCNKSRGNTGNTSSGNKSGGHKTSGSRTGGNQTGGNRSGGHKSSGNANWSHNVDPAVMAMQDAGGELSKLFKSLKDENVSEMLVKAIRHRDARAVQKLLGCHCFVLSFFHCGNKDCVRICCTFGRNREVTISFDICVKRAENHCGCNW